MLLQPVILGSQNATSAADGGTIAPRMRISRSDEGSARCKRSWEDMGSPQRFLSISRSLYNTFNVQRDLTSARTHRAFRASALQTWREVVAAA
jgi:hypothetical protein